MNDDEYITSRVDNQIGWYDKKSQSAQCWFKWLRGAEIIAAASIPLIAGFATEPFPVTLVVGLLGASIAVISALISLNQFQENWTEYRTTCESIKHEKFLYMTKAEPYHEGEPFPRFVQRVESLISKENSAWAQYTQANLENIKPNNEKG
ncbi:DUF4231 domain-containing protein [Paraferrimonas sp. SM1919]|uniref:DUF4231 domain-containing protein n=1 Tax=Paraferrimonas sp. SM1919 TaxID=2662263 RepID=UPI0013D64FF7|nr:DUF4231 domain-containing protein [Paraferrimonas sp. SM1919]